MGMRRVKSKTENRISKQDKVVKTNRDLWTTVSLSMKKFKKDEKTLIIIKLTKFLTPQPPANSQCRFRS